MRSEETHYYTVNNATALYKKQGEHQGISNTHDTQRYWMSINLRQRPLTFVTHAAPLIFMKSAQFQTIQPFQYTLKVSSCPYHSVATKAPSPCNFCEPLHHESFRKIFEPHFACCFKSYPLEVVPKSRTGD